MLNLTTVFDELLTLFRHTKNTSEHAVLPLIGMLYERFTNHETRPKASLLTLPYQGL